MNLKIIKMQINFLLNLFKKEILIMKIFSFLVNKITLKIKYINNKANKLYNLINLILIPQGNIFYLFKTEEYYNKEMIKMKIKIKIRKI